MKKIFLCLILVCSLNISYAQDIQITITVPDAYTQRLKTWIDETNPKPSGVTYPAWLKTLIIQKLKKEVSRYEWEKAQGAISITDIEVN